MNKFVARSIGAFAVGCVANIVVHLAGYSMPPLTLSAIVWVATMAFVQVGLDMVFGGINET